MLKFKALASSSSGNLYKVSDDDGAILIEAGLPIKRIRQKLDFELHKIDFAVLSHSHRDHSMAASDLMKAGVDLYTSQGTIDACGLEGHRLHRIRDRVQFVRDGWSVLPFATEHDDSEPLGFLIERKGQRLLFVTDSYYIRYSFERLNIIAVECSYSREILDENVANGTIPLGLKERLRSSHMALHTLVEFLEATDLGAVREIHLLHMSETNSDKDAFKKEIQKFGKVVKIA